MLDAQAFHTVIGAGTDLAIIALIKESKKQNKTSRGRSRRPAPAHWLTRVK